MQNCNTFTGKQRNELQNPRFRCAKVKPKICIVGQYPVVHVHIGTFYLLDSNPAISRIFLKNFTDKIKLTADNTKLVKVCLFCRLDSLNSGIQLVQYPLGVGEEKLTVLSQRNLAPTALKELDTQIVLQPGQRGGEVGLADKQGLGCPGDVFILRNGAEILEL